MSRNNNIPKGWKIYKFTDIAEIIGGGTPSKKNPDYWNGNIDWLTVTDFNTGRKYVRNAEQKITKLGLEKSSAKILKEGQIIISARGTVGVIAVLGKDMAFNQSNYGINAKEDITFNDFLYYLLKYKINELKQASYGAVFDTITKSTFENLQIELPPLPEQKAIASVLSSLDDKIDLLHRENKTLEAMAETLFRQWFIEEAKEDWKKKPLDEIANYLNGLACQKYPPKNKVDKLPVLKIKELKNGFTKYPDWATSNVSSEYIVQNGDVIFSWSGSLLVKIWDGERCVLNQHLFKVTSENYPKWFYYFWTKYHLENFITIAESKATTMGHIKRKDLSASMVVVPPCNVLEEMNKSMSPIINKIIINNRQIRTLEQLRDTLLPKLMSGKVRVKK
ncbi:restriction endonuclease subunit S [Mesoaciditoga lauensis]|uniref:restriction endonuclease subunit S n=1 Tax=Mesoaciditoga lauensis TaxID=1495039 RepID=UPI00069251C1|nr:restriction endonuclease subunit S [Mesoaciditoga lauensis]